LKKSSVLSWPEELGALSELRQLTQQLPVETLPEFLGALETIRCECMARLYASRTGATPQRDELLTVEQAAQRLKVSRDYLYRNSRGLPFARKIGGALRFSAAAIDAYLRRPR
jgi:excisionase family DNA binding protein